MSRLEEILELVKDLTPEERKRLRLELSKPYKPNEAGTSEPDWLLEGFILELYNRGLFIKGSVHEVPKAYVEQAGAVKANILKHINKPMSYSDKLKLGRVIAQCLIYYLGSEAPISLKFLCNSVGHVLPAIERSFPGYMRSNLLGHLVK